MKRIVIYITIFFVSLNSYGQSKDQIISLLFYLNTLETYDSLCIQISSINDYKLLYNTNDSCSFKMDDNTSNADSIILTVKDDQIIYFHWRGIDPAKNLEFERYYKTLEIALDDYYELLKDITEEFNTNIELYKFKISGEYLKFNLVDSTSFIKMSNFQNLGNLNLILCI